MSERIRAKNPEILQPQRERVAVLDAGAQYVAPIDRRVRALAVESHILPIETPASELAGYSAIIISGGPESVYAENAPKCDLEIFNLGKPILGICYGMHLLVHQSGGKVVAGERREDGPCSIIIESESMLFEGLDSNQEVLMSHGDSIVELPLGFRAIADSDGIIAAIEDPGRKIYAVQFHPEVDLTENGSDMIRNFLYGISGLSGEFTMEDRKTKAIAEIQETVGERAVLAMVSGGVDSTVTAALLNEALGEDRIIAMYVDNGFMREGETAEVTAALGANGLELMVVDASEQFFAQLEGVIHPETKRKIIGDTFVDVVENTIQRLGLDEQDVVLAQGTLRTDLIESASALASGKAHTIKTHHNDSAAVREMRAAGRVVEPLSGYHKDEVRELGLQLGLPEEAIWRQPFPGPGIAIRVLCAEESFIEEDFQAVQEGLDVFSNEMITATLVPIKTVGVQGDARTYNYLAGLSGERDWDQLMALARAIPKTAHQINRVVYVFGDRLEKPVINITPTTLTPETVGQLREADDVVNNVLQKYNLLRSLSQVPVILFPVGFGIPGNRSVAIRPFITNDFMTGRPAVPGIDIPEEALDEIVERVLEISGISRVVYDLTSKPPGTTEWE